MKATFVLLADPPAENLGRKLMLEAHRIGGMGFEMARLPHHISLKQPFEISSLESVEEYFDSFASTLKPVKVKLNDIMLWRSNIFGSDSGVLVVGVDKTDELFDLHMRLNKELEIKFGNTQAEYDGDNYSFHMTFAIGGASYDEYYNAYEILRRSGINEEYTFSELGLLFYDGDEISQGSYFCYKRMPL